MPKMNFTTNFFPKFPHEINFQANVVWIFFTMLVIPKSNNMHFITRNSHMLFMSTFSKVGQTNRWTWWFLYLYICPNTLSEWVAVRQTSDAVELELVPGLWNTQQSTKCQCPFKEAISQIVMHNQVCGWLNDFIKFQSR